MSQVLSPLTDPGDVSELRRQKALKQLELLDTPPEVAFDRLTDLARRIFDTPIALVSLVDAHRAWFKSKYGIDADEVPEVPTSISFCRYTIRRNSVLVVNDARIHPQFKDNPIVTKDPYICFYAGAPLRLKSGYAIGTLCVADRKPRNFSQKESAELRLLAGLVVGEAENRILKRRVSRRTASLRIARRMSESANRAKSDFLSNISHELRTPLHAILNYTKIGAKRFENGDLETVRTDLTKIRTSGLRLLRLLNDLLDLEKLESGKTAYLFSRQDLADVIMLAIMEIEPLLKERQVTLHFDIHTKYTFAILDEQKLLQVLVNLLSNALKYSPCYAEIYVSLSDAVLPNERKALLCSISDEGNGIPESELELVFDKFVQSSKTATGAGGTGLGLSICRQIINAHGGRIWAENNPRGGALLRFILPREPPEALIGP
jgi:signal transduction histidine kinase